METHPQDAEEEWEYHPFGPEITAYEGPRWRRRKAGPWLLDDATEGDNGDVSRLGG